MGDNDRYCSVEESLKTSLNQIQLIKNGGISKKSWKEFCSEIDKENCDEDAN